MVAIAQLVRASDCDSEGRGFEPLWLPRNSPLKRGIFILAPLINLVFRLFCLTKHYWHYGVNIRLEELIL